MAKKKIKRFLKKAVPLLAVAGLGKAFMNARNRRNQMKDFLATEGGNLSDMSNISVDSGRGGDSASAMARSVANTPAKVFQDDIMRGGSGVKFMPNRNPKSIRVEGETINPFGFMFKKGGRVKKGFAKKKKQANKMRKK